MTLECDTLLQIKNDGMPLFLTSANLYQQTRAIHHANISEHNITTYRPFYYHQTHTLKFPHQNKTIKHSQEQS